MSKNEISTSIGELYPQLSLEEQREAEENLRRYLGVVKRIFENVRLEKPEILTELRVRVRLRKEGAKKTLR
jgi:hypothetical protein